MSANKPKIECQSCCEEVADIIVCSACQWTACVSCTQQYVLTVDTAQCMSCKRGWDEYFIRKAFSASWITKSYTPHVKKRLLSQERSFLPESQAYVDSYKQYKQTLEKLEKMKTTKSDKEKHYEQIMAELSNKMESLKVRDRVARRELKEKFREAQCSLWVARGERNQEIYQNKLDKDHLRSSIRNFSDDASSELKNNKQIYNRPCIVKNCRGYLDKSWNCGLCNVKVCSKCRVIVAEEEHKCDPSTVESVALIEKECMPCPNCDERIFRPSGCDHMFCTACNTGFSWKTGQRISDRENTNPFFREYRANRLAATINLPTNPSNDGGCVTYTYAHVYRYLKDMFNKLPPWKQSNPIWSFLRELDSFKAECERVRRPIQYNPLYNRYARVKYIAGDIDEKELATAAMKEYKKHQYDEHLYQLNSTFVQSLNDWMHSFYIKLHDIQVNMNTLNDKITHHEHFKELEALINYFNAESLALVKLFGYSVYKKYTYYPMSNPNPTHIGNDYFLSETVSLKKEVKEKKKREEKQVEKKEELPAKHAAKEFRNGIEVIDLLD